MAACDYSVVVDAAPLGLTFVDGLDIPCVESVSASGTASTAYSTKGRKVRAGDRLVGINGKDVSQYGTAHVLALLADETWRLRQPGDGGGSGNAVGGNLGNASSSSASRRPVQELVLRFRPAVVDKDACGVLDVSDASAERSRGRWASGRHSVDDEHSQSPDGRHDRLSSRSSPQRGDHVRGLVRQFESATSLQDIHQRVSAERAALIRLRAERLKEERLREARRREERAKAEAERLARVHYINQQRQLNDGRGSVTDSTDSAPSRRRRRASLERDGPSRGRSSRRVTSSSRRDDGDGGRGDGDSGSSDTENPSSRDDAPPLQQSRHLGRPTPAASQRQRDRERSQGRSGGVAASRSTSPRRDAAAPAALAVRVTASDAAQSRRVRSQLKAGDDDASRRYGDEHRDRRTSEHGDERQRGREVHRGATRSRSVSVDRNERPTSRGRSASRERGGGGDVAAAGTTAELQRLHSCIQKLETCMGAIVKVALSPRVLGASAGPSSEGTPGRSTPPRSSSPRSSSPRPAQQRAASPRATSPRLRASSPRCASAGALSSVSTPSLEEANAAVARAAATVQALVDGPSHSPAAFGDHHRDRDAGSRRTGSPDCNPTPKLHQPAVLPAGVVMQPSPSPSPGIMMMRGGATPVMHHAVDTTAGANSVRSSGGGGGGGVGSSDAMHLQLELRQQLQQLVQQQKQLQSRLDALAGSGADTQLSLVPFEDHDGQQHQQQRRVRATASRASERATNPYARSPRVSTTPATAAPAVPQPRFLRRGAGFGGGATTDSKPRVASALRRLNSDMCGSCNSPLSAAPTAAAAAAAASGRGGAHVRRSLHAERLSHGDAAAHAGVPEGFSPRWCSVDASARGGCAVCASAAMCRCGHVQLPHAAVPHWHLGHAQAPQPALPVPPTATRPFGLSHHHMHGYGGVLDDSLLLSPSTCDAGSVGDVAEQVLEHASLDNLRQVLRTIANPHAVVGGDGAVGGVDAGVHGGVTVGAGTAAVVAIGGTGGAASGVSHSIVDLGSAPATARGSLVRSGVSGVVAPRAAVADKAVGGDGGANTIFSQRPRQVPALSRSSAPPPEDAAAYVRVV